MSIPNCPYCGKKMMIERVDLGGGKGYVKNPFRGYDFTFVYDK